MARRASITTGKWATEGQRMQIKHILEAALMHTDITRGGAQRIVEQGDILQKQVEAALRDLREPPFKTLGNPFSLTIDHKTSRHKLIHSPEFKLDDYRIDRFATEKCPGPSKGLYQLVCFTEKINYYAAIKMLKMEGLLPANIRELIAAIQAYQKDRQGMLSLSRLSGDHVLAIEDFYTEGASADAWIPAAYTAGPTAPIHLLVDYWPHYSLAKTLVRLLAY